MADSPIHRDEAVTQPTASTPAATRPLVRRLLPHVAWISLILVVVAVQWPMVKGIAYGLVGSPPPSNIDWQTDYLAALDLAAATGKPVLATFTADWCPPCRVMKHETWPDPRVEDAVNRHTVPLYLDLDRPGVDRIAARYHVQFVPTVLLLDPQGNVLRTGSFMTPDQLLGFFGQPTD
jgi:thiol:disulfide interchange protein